MINQNRRFKERQASVTKGRGGGFVNVANSTKATTTSVLPTKRALNQASLRQKVDNLTVTET